MNIDLLIPALLAIAFLIVLVRAVLASLGLGRNLNGRSVQEKWLTTLFVAIWVVIVLAGQFYPVVEQRNWLEGYPASLVGTALIGGTFFSLLLWWQLRNWGWDIKAGQIFLGFVFILYATFSLLSFVNGALDNSSLQTHNATLVSKTTSKPRRTTHYKLYVADWRSPSNEITIEVSPWVYNSKNAGTPVKILTHQGFFGWEWIARVE